jgi:prepilin-type N-terminal cleavage/methylation domain-containing protein
MCYSDYMRKTTSGFTIIELIVVIVVIGILASITIVAYRDFQARSLASIIQTNLKDIEKPLRVYAAEQQWSSWPLDTAIDPGKTNPSIQNLIDDIPAFKQYLKAAPTASGFPASAWIYDYDGDIKPDCGSRTNGTNILVTSVPQNVATYIDAAMDDGSDTCGRVRYEPSTLRLFYSLSYTNDLSL